MPVSQLPQAPYRQDRKIFPTPIIGDVLFSEVRDCNRGNPFPEYGTPHPNPARWPDHKLVYVKPVDIERNEIFEFFYAAERENQDLYNFAFGNRVVGNREFRTVTRTYVTLRENFKPVDIEFGTPMPDIPDGKFDGVSYVFYDKEQQNTQQEELNALFVIEAHSYVEAAVLDEQLSLSVEKQDPLPPKFRVLSPTTTTEELAEGEVTTPTLTGDQLAAAEDQINTNLKRKRTTSRSSAENIGSLSGKQVTNVLQVADVVESIVPDGTTITTTALTVDGSVEPLGNGQSLQRVITAPELFTAKSYSTQRPDPVPEKFRVLAPTKNTEETVEGTAEMPTLVTGEFQAAEQQVNVHVKRKSSTKRDVTILPKSITQKVTTGEKQVATITDTLQNGDTTEAPSATKDIQSDALGDGTYVVRKVEVPELFNNRSVSVERPEVIPEKFIADSLTRTYIGNVGVSNPDQLDGVIGDITLDENDLAIRRQKVNNFVYTEQKTIRNNSTTPTLEGSQTYVNGTIAIIKEEILSKEKGDDLKADSGFYVEQSKVTPLGGGKYLKETVEVDSYPELLSGEVDPIIQKFSLTKQTFITAEEARDQLLAESSIKSDPVTKIQSINGDRALKLEEFPPDGIDKFFTTTRTTVSLTIPPELKSIKVIWDEDKSDGYYEEQEEGTGESVDEGTISFSASGNISGSASATPVLDVELVSVWASDVPATNYFFFTKEIENLTKALNTVARIVHYENNPVDIPFVESFWTWPYFKPKTFTITSIGKSLTATLRSSVSRSLSKSVDREAESRGQGRGETGAVDTRVDVIKIGPCLCEGIDIIGDVEKKVTAEVSGTYSVKYDTTAKVSPSSFGATTPTRVPTYGKYVISARAEPYKWGYYRVVATVVDAKDFNAAE